MGSRGALAAMVVFSLALGITNGVSTAASSTFGWPRLATSLLQAVLCTGLTTTGVLWLARRGRVHPAWFGLRRPGLGRDLLVGLTVVLASAALVIGLSAAAGLLSVTSVRPAELAVFLVTTAVVATGFEAFPEELAFRGFAFSSLRTSWSTPLAAIAATVLFLLAPGLSLVVSSAIDWVLTNGSAPSWSPAPAGEDPVAYLVFLTFWSVCLLSARRLTGSIWTGVAAHLVMLIINRLLLSPASGLVVELAHPDVVLILPAYVLLAALGFTLLRRYRSRRVQLSPLEQRV